MSEPEKKWSFKDVADMFELREQGCSTRVVDLHKSSVIRRVEDGVDQYYLSFENEELRLTSDWPIKQICKLAKVPFSFYKKCSVDLNGNIMQEWLPNLSEDKAKVVLKLRQMGERAPIIRGVLPLTYADVTPLSIWQKLTKDLSEKEWRVECFDGNGLDTPAQHLRLVSNETFVVGTEELSLGFSLQMSDLGATPLLLDTLVFKQICKNGTIMSYAGQSYLNIKYEGMQASDIETVFGNVAQRLTKDLPAVRDILKEKMENPLSAIEAKAALDSFKEMKGVPTALADKVRGALSQEPNQTLWLFSDKVTQFAQDEKSFRSRISRERIGGKLAGLDLGPRVLPQAA